jgi:Ca2+-binding RTX toxin-like protein
VRVRRRGRLLTLPVAVLATLACAGPAGADSVVGLTDGNQLVQFDSANPSAPSAPVPITGLPAGESIVGIDFRPAGGQLYGVGQSNRLYTINPTTGGATPVGSQGAFTLSGNAFGITFDPVSDRIRVVSDADQNQSLNPNDGTPAAGGALAFEAGDSNAGQNPAVVGSAHTNSVAGASSTTLFGIDSNLDILVRQNPATGQLTTVGPLGVNPANLLGFDIATDAAGTAFFVAGFPFGSFFHTINLTTGTATDAGTIPIPNITGLAVIPPATYEVPPPPGPAPELRGCPPKTTPRNLIVLTDGDDTATGTALDDLIFAGRGDDEVKALGGDDCVDADAGDDIVRGGPGNDFLPGGTGNDRIAGRTGNDRIAGGSGRDRLRGGSGRDRLSGGGAADRISGRSGRDRISGGGGRDRISGGGSADRAKGGSGRDRIAGGAGADRLSGGRGDDRIRGGAGNNRVSAGPGDDRISNRGDGESRVDCGVGVDRVFADPGDQVAPNCEEVL